MTLRANLPPSPVILIHKGSLGFLGMPVFLPRASSGRGVILPLLLARREGQHMRSGLLCSTFAAAILVTGAASAADLGRPAPAPVYTKAAPLQATCIWCGFYAGVDAGYAWSR